MLVQSRTLGGFWASGFFAGHHGLALRCPQEQAQPHASRGHTMNVRVAGDRNTPGTSRLIKRAALRADVEIISSRCHPAPRVRTYLPHVCCWPRHTRRKEATVAENLGCRKKKIVSRIILALLYPVSFFFFFLVLLISIFFRLKTRQVDSCILQGNDHAE